MTNEFSIARRFRGFLPVVVDFETGGFNSSTDALLEIAIVHVDPQDDGTLLRGGTIRFQVHADSDSRAPQATDDDGIFAGLNRIARPSGPGSGSGIAGTAIFEAMQRN